MLRFSIDLGQNKYVEIDYALGVSHAEYVEEVSILGPNGIMTREFRWDSIETFLQAISDITNFLLLQQKDYAGEEGSK